MQHVRESEFTSTISFFACIYRAYFIYATTRSLAYVRKIDICKVALLWVAVGADYRSLGDTNTVNRLAAAW